jgi:hypothetical protein
VSYRRPVIRFAFVPSEYLRIDLSFSGHQVVRGGGTEMSTAMASWRRRRQVARTRRELGRALDSASTPAMHQELVTLASSRNWVNATR